MPQDSREFPANALQGLLGLAYGVVAYAAFNASVIYCIGFLANFLVPLSIDSGPTADPLWAALIDILLLALFGLQHSIMARPGFKSTCLRMIPAALERSTYLVASSLALALVLWQWHPIPALAWHIEAEWARICLWIVFAAGWLIALSATFMTNHFELLGLKQSYCYFRRKLCVPSEFREHSYYRWVRHPIMLGQLIGFWATPTMTLGHLLFATVMLIYILIGLYFEERDLLTTHGEAYRDYQKRIPKLIPRPPRNMPS